MNKMYLEDLQDIIDRGCQAPGCDHKSHSSSFYLNSRCHPGVGVIMNFSASNTYIDITCATCNTYITSIEIAKRPQH